ncbi:MAG: desulfoferrodoxin family protein [Eubacterium sp.]|nr:desulfoferrodoxin family protein [Eubacterium sp.]
MLKIYKCNHCGNIVEVVNDAQVVPVCCGEPMKELKANTTDAAQEKHVPEVTVEGNLVKVKVGSVEHPMTEEHHIAFIYLETENGVARKDLNHTGAPEAVFALAEGEKAVAAYEYCNLHGLWKKEL